MNNLYAVLLLIFLTAPAPVLCQAEEKANTLQTVQGTLSGILVTADDKPLTGGGVSFFDSRKGIPPLLANTHRIPDVIGRMASDGTFRIKLQPGTYYMGALIITDRSRGPGPPRKGEPFYFAIDGQGNLRELTIGPNEIKDAGRVIAAPPESFPAAKNLVTIQGRLLLADGKPFAGAVVLVKTDMNKTRPDFVSGRTGKDGGYSIRLPPDTPYYLIGRERTIGQRPVPGSYVGTYGSTTPISEGGSLPVTGVMTAQPISTMPQVDGVAIGPADQLPTPVMGGAGRTLTGYDILMFKVPVPGEQRKKRQGTMGMGFDEPLVKQKKSAWQVPILDSPARP